jgi:FAD/FMN-containing dehydrogenase
MPTSIADQIDLATLRTGIRGRVLASDDAGYDAARTLFAGGLEGRPALIVQVADTADVARVIALARETGLPLAVRSGGHSGAGHSSSEGGIVLDLREMKDLTIDVDRRTAWAETGLTAGEFTAAAAEHGLATGFGDTASVGLGGLTVGGGVGYLSRKFGLTVDNLLAAEVVTADCTLRRVDAENEPELFWAIRGGGGNFGVATRFLFQLHPVDQVVGGMLVLPASAETVAGFVAAAQNAGDDLTTIANVMNCPPLPFVPQEHHGSPVIMALMCFAGDVAAGEAALQPFRDLAAPLADLLRPMAYPEIYPPEDPDYHPTAVARTMFMDDVGHEVAQLIVDRVRSSDAPLRAVQLRVLGGAISQVPAGATAYAHRTSRIMTNVASFYAGPDDRDRRLAWVVELAADLRQSDDGVYVNFLADEGEARVRAAYPAATWDRLRAVKAAYDPGNLFRLNQNVPPPTSAESGG